MKPGEMLTAILVLATQRHAGQYDKQGLPYILHPLKVMYYLDTDEEELQCIAIGHDLIEDTKTTYEELRNIGMTERIIEGIRCLTRVPGETEQEYQFRIKSNPDAIKVKLADLRHNTDIRRLRGIGPKDLERIQKYHKFYLELKELVAH
jgi:(p)ppGpp synthase/HD superfamily hydrolase